MSTPELTATLSLSLRVDPRDDLSLCLNTQVMVERTIEGYRARFTDTASQYVLPPTDAATAYYDNPETAMLAGVAELLAQTEDRLESAIEGEFDHV